MLCMCVCKINIEKIMLHPSKMIRFSRYFRFSLLIPLCQSKGFQLKHQHTVHSFSFLLNIFLLQFYNI